MHSFFFCEVQLITVFFIIRGYLSWSTRFVSLKVNVEFSISNSVSFLLEFIYIFVQHKA